MKYIDKIIYVALGLIGGFIELNKIILHYITGLIWVLYSMIRNFDYKKGFTSLNRSTAEELKRVLKYFILCFK